MAMRIALAFVAIVGLVVADSIQRGDTTSADKEYLAKQKFLLEIVYRAEDPLMFENYVKLGKSFTYNKNDYKDYDHHSEEMDRYYKAYKFGVTLPKGEFFGATVPIHYEQLRGLFGFFYSAKNWNIFKRNVCWGRLHANEGMFVQALTLALIHRPDMQGLLLPAIYEIFPQHFFNSKFVYQAEKFDYNVWSKLIMYEKDYKDFMYTNYPKYFKDIDNYKYFYNRDWKMWQWWKLMGLGEHWYTEDRYMLRDNIDVVKEAGIFKDMLKNVNMFWMPVDYTRNRELYNRESELSYFTEDLEWNSLWYYFNLDYAAFLDGQKFGLKKDRRGEYWLFVVRQILTRYNLERLSHGLGDIDEFSFFHKIQNGYDPQLVHHNGGRFSYRENNYKFEVHENIDQLKKVLSFFKRLDDIITEGYYLTATGQKIDMRQPQAIEELGDILQGNVDNYDKYFATFWFMYAHTYIAEMDVHKDLVQPNIFLNYETMMRDPLYYMVYKKFSDIFYHFQSYIKPYTQEELLLPGVTIRDVQVSDLITYFDLFDFDVTNLLNDEMKFVNGEFVWDKTLLARQMRLNHVPYELKFTVDSQKEQKVVVRIFLAPKYDEFGRVLSLKENRENFMQVDNFIQELTSGVNTFIRKSDDFNWVLGDRMTYTELYNYVRLAEQGKYNYTLDQLKARFTTTHCSFPKRLVIPRGWAHGLPLQFFFILTPYNGSVEHYNSASYSTFCDVGSGLRHLDAAALGYPFDREINEFEFIVPNMYFKDVKVYHENRFEKYYDLKEEALGKFDYN